MTEIFDANTLERASSWLKEETGVEWGPGDFIELGAMDQISLITVIPGWIAPGVGELSIRRLITNEGAEQRQNSSDEPGYRISAGHVSDGLWRVDARLLKTLLTHERASLNNLLEVVGQAPFIDASHIRISADELVKLSAILNSNGTSTPKCADMAKDNKRRLTNNERSDSGIHDDTGANRVYWRVVLNKKIREFDNAAKNGKANVRAVIKALRALGDNRLPNKGGEDSLVWLDDYNTEHSATKKTVSTAMSKARKHPR